MDVLDCDVVIIGGGIAGLSAAAHIGRRRVALLTLGPSAETGSSPLARGGIAAALGPGDSPAQHFDDTLAAGVGLCEPKAVATLCDEIGARVAELAAHGAPFDRDGDGALALGREAAHRRRRIVHAGGDQTGLAVVATLSQWVRSRDNATRVLGRALRLVCHEGRIAGVIARAETGEPLLLRAADVVLATGGIGALFASTTNPATATGEGLGLAFDAGAELIDLEFVQFHPTALAVNAVPRPLLTEALRGDGARLVDASGQSFVRAPQGDLAPRDIVARAVQEQISSDGAAFLDLSNVTALEQRFPAAVLAIAEAGVSAHAAVPVEPAAHYHMGGVAVDLRGRTSVPGLWACGEVAHTGVHGANRLASNSLAEALVFGARVGAELAHQEARRRPRCGIPRGLLLRPETAQADRQARMSMMSENVGLLRRAEGLDEAAQALTEAWHSAGDIEHNQLVAALLVATAGRLREESRGGHFRTDRPDTSDTSLGRFVCTPPVIGLNEGPVPPSPSHFRFVAVGRDRVRA